jgi:hypothetical protein
MLWCGCEPTGALPGGSPCPPGTYGPFYCDGPQCGGLAAGCLVNQDGAEFGFVSCSLAGFLDTKEPTCNDMKMNGDETYIDCGGTCPVGCVNTRPCMQNSDCAGGCCTSDGACDDDADENGVCDSEDEVTRE